MSDRPPAGASAPSALPVYATFEDYWNRPTEYAAYTRSKDAWVRSLQREAWEAAAASRQVEVDRLQEVLLGGPWPLLSVLEQLVDATAHSLVEHSCDRLGHELDAAAVLRAREIIALLNGQYQDHQKPSEDG